MMIDPKELVSKKVFDVCISRNIDPYILIDSRLLIVYKLLKTEFPEIYVNNWSSGGDLEQSGYRDNASVGASLSQHKFGRALDIHGVSNRILYDYILKNKRKFEYITTIEDLKCTDGWLHIDVRTGSKSFRIIEPIR